ncbi:MAG: AAA family ATPase [Bacteroidetes bacterium]|nr:AAA family ATPase [Bacteroidota bacterium]
MKEQQFAELLIEEFPYTPTVDQIELLKSLSEFIYRQEDNSLFIIKGYAGTGKTTVVSNLVKVLPKIKAKTILLAPTGRAAKVMASYSREKAYTIHKKIYRINAGKDGLPGLKMIENKHKNTFFLVDEASMISAISQDGGELFSGRNLLDDLIQYVYSGDNCRLILIGDTAQLPPVKAVESPALSPEFMKASFHLTVWVSELREVVRQAQDSGILYNATLIRKMLLLNSKGFPRLDLQGFDDIKRLEGQDVGDEITSAFSNRQCEESVIVCRSNKRANLFNKNIRNRILLREEEISAGDLMMVVKNNYFWLPQTSQIGFIANGDIIELTRIRKIEELYGFRFADVSARMLDYPDEPEIDVMIMLDAIYADAPSLTFQQTGQLFEQVSLDYAEYASKRTRLLKVKSNPYFNALQVKFAYSLTCHKAQGGQWKNVFVEMGYIHDNNPDIEYLRWLYTAFTRATDNLYLIGFNDEFFV